MVLPGNRRCTQTVWLGGFDRGTTYKSISREEVNWQGILITLSWDSNRRFATIPRPGGTKGESTTGTQQCRVLYDNSCGLQEGCNRETEVILWKQSQNNHYPSLLFLQLSLCADASIPSSGLLLTCMDGMNGLPCSLASG